MRAVDRLKRDHAVLRAKLDVLEAALSTGPEAWFVLREMCFTLARQLHDHIRREEDLAATCRNAMNPKVLAELSVTHRDEPQHLRTINQLFIGAPSHALARIRPSLLEVIEGLRRHMAEEEAEFFPILERVLGGREETAGATPSAGPRVKLDETMTVNRVLQEYPQTKRTLERFFVNIPYEGCSCLDEVAWQHGIECKDLLESLERAITSGEEEVSRVTPPALCGCATVN